MIKKRVFIVSVILMLALSLQAFAETPVYKEGSRGAGPGSTGWVAMKDGTWKYLDGKGYAKECWQEIDGSWYWFQADGLMQTGWQEIGSRWYWFDTDGKMRTGWQNINGEEFYFTETADENHPQGSCYMNENTPDGFTTNERGVKTGRVGPNTANRPNPYGYSCVEVSIPEQMMYCYIGQNLMLASPCVTGRPGGRSTSVGHWHINSKERSRYLRGPGYRSWVNYWMPFHGGQGLHDATWRGAFGGNIYTYSGSHGCVNLPLDIAAQLYSLVYVGMPVIVHN